MRKVVMAVLVGMVLASGCTRVEPGYTGIRVDLVGSERGVKDIPIVTGRVFYNPWSEAIYEFPTFIQRAAWEGNNAVTFRAAKGISVSADVAVSYKFSANKVPALFVEFRKDPDTITNGYVRDAVTKAFGQFAGGMDVMDVLGAKATELTASVTTEVNKQFEHRGIVIDSISFIGKPRVDASVEAAINQVIAMQQQANTAEAKVREVQAQAQQQIAAAEGQAKAITLKAQAEADANKVLNESLTDKVLQFRAIERWNGAQPQVTSGQPLISLGLK